MTLINPHPVCVKWQPAGMQQYVGGKREGVAVHISCCVCQTGIGGEGWVVMAQMKEGEGGGGCQWLGSKSHLRKTRSTISPLLYRRRKAFTTA